MTEAHRRAFTQRANVVRTAVQIAEALTALGRPASERELRGIVQAHRMQLREALGAAIAAGAVECFPTQERVLFGRKRTSPTAQPVAAL